MKALTSRQFSEWKEYFKQEPWGFPAEDTRYAVSTASICRSMGAKVKPDDFVFRAEEEEADEPTPRQFAEALRIALGAKEVARG